MRTIEKVDWPRDFIEKPGVPPGGKDIPNAEANRGKGPIATR